MLWRKIKQGGVKGKVFEADLTKKVTSKGGMGGRHTSGCLGEEHYRPRRARAKALRLERLTCSS